MNPTSGNTLGPISKKWADQSAEERVETLRQELQMNRYVTTRVAKLESQIQKLLEHQHGPDGSALFPHKEDHFFGGMGASTYDRLA